MKNQTPSKAKHHDVIIVGGGAAGMFAAISVKQKKPLQSVAILDRTFALGRKILVCGAGRCNVTNIHLSEKISTAYYGAQNDFVHSIFNQFGFEEIVHFFKDLGVELYVERKTDIGKLFPVTNQASTITEMLIDEINRLGIQVYLNHEVTKINKRQATFTINVHELERSGKIIQPKVFTAEKIVISAGGKSYPALGANGSGYTIAGSFGHTTVKPVPAALPLETESNQWSHLLQGQKMEIEVTSIINSKKIKTTTDDVMFKKYGLSGPAILNISREISIHINRDGKLNAHVSLNFFPGKNRNEVISFIHNRWSKRPNQTLVKSFYGLFPNKIAHAMFQIFKINEDQLVSEFIDTKNFYTLINRLMEVKFKVINTRGWNEAEFTAGGVKSTEIKKSTLESKYVPNLYFCGEIIDVDGDVGGFNLSWSWSSGYVAGLLQ